MGLRDGGRGVRARIKARRNAKKPVQQFYGGTPEEAAKLRARNQAGMDAGAARETQGLDAMDRERQLASGDLRSISAQTQGERDQAAQQIQQIDAEASGRQRLNARDMGNYGRGADRSIGDYRSVRDPLLGGASELEELGRSAPGRYQSAADAAFNASAERNQRSALSLAAGRGNDSIRSALATAEAGNRQAQLDQQVVRAQEMNDLLGLQRDTLRGAADVRAGVGASDITAAQTLAQRQQASGDAVNKLLGLRGDLTGTNAEVGLATTAQRGGLATTDASLGLSTAGARAEAGAGARGAFLGAEGAQEGSQIGADQAAEAARLANAQTKGFTGFMQKLSGGLGATKDTLDKGHVGPGAKLLGGG